MFNDALPYIAGLLQWARARQKFAEVWYLAIVAGASFGFYFLAHYPNALTVPLPEILGGWWEQAKIILAMTQIVSSGANVIHAAGGNGTVSAALPVTNSQE